MQIDLAKVATALITTLVVGAMTYQLTTIRQLEIDNELIKVRLEYVEKKLKKRGKNK
jgi:hypothetical protein